MTELTITGVRKAFAGLAVLRGVDLSVPESSFTAILGPSGSGKTTLLRIIAGFERPDAGQIRLGDTVVDNAEDTWVPCEKRRIGYVPQEGALFPHLSVGRNVAFGLQRTLGHRGHGLGHRGHGHGHGRGDGRRGDGEQGDGQWGDGQRVRGRGRVDELLELVGLSGMARRYPHQLSGGQQQRVALARALATEPEIVLLDEPFSSLDASLRASVRADVHDVLRRAGTTVILVTHDQDEALSMADRVAILRDGVIGQIDTPAGLYGLPLDAELAEFLGEGNFLDGRMDGRVVHTALGALPVAAWNGAQPAAGGSESGLGWGPGRVLVRPEQLVLEVRRAGTDGTAGVVRSYEYFGHDAVVRVDPAEGSDLPQLVVRVTGGTPLSPGTEVGVTVQGSVVAWSREAEVSPPEPAVAEDGRPPSEVLAQGHE